MEGHDEKSLKSGLDTETPRDIKNQHTRIFGMYGICAGTSVVVKECEVVAFQEEKVGRPGARCVILSLSFGSFFKKKAV